MTISARPTGQDPVSRLLWEISNQLDQLIKIMGSLTETETTTTTTNL